MSGVAPIGSTPEYLFRREHELERQKESETASRAEQPKAEVKSVPEAKSDAARQAEQATLYDFRYTGKGSFIDKVF
ncbi:hypothetical protein BerOc1_00013 [Pseudodesulfovibrio hydrargyri]|uniref:Uncharacterized protein n=1 Tax=Pseudodesulfovibrio hydrargyri TaxID=2125990 RepID=A0A1J5NEC0_9BACT|nr:hypothetical protein [Pseudodesulfovibrio hydrargyri]OIQ51559.1 hypothetical protein BerOc1_00013 [Pseudodesulfovibrio hydrargyri]